LNSFKKELTIAGFDGGNISSEGGTSPASAGGRTVASRVNSQVQAIVHVGRESAHRCAAVCKQEKKIL
jgi:hypothetical protein